MSEATGLRRSIRLAGYDYTQVGAYFVTVCTRDRECLLGDIIGGEMRLNDVGHVVREEWERTSRARANVILDASVVMPNHIHGIVIINDSVVGATRRVAPTGPHAGSIGAIMGQFTSLCTKRVNALRGMPAGSIWQRNYYEHVIRNEAALERVRRYIAGNPQQWGEDPENPAVAAHTVTRGQARVP